MFLKGWQAEKLREFHGHGGPIWCLDVDHARGRLVSGSYDKTLKIWDLATGRCERTLRGHSGWVSCLRVDSSADRIISGSWDATIKLWDSEGGTMRQSFHCGLGNALHCLDLDLHTANVAVGCVPLAQLSSLSFVIPRFSFVVLRFSFFVPRPPSLVHLR